jgi:phage-related protein
MHKARFYSTMAGNEVVRDWIRNLARADQGIVGRDLLAVQLGFPMGLPLCRSLGGGLWEIRSTLSNRTEARMIFYFDSPLQAVVVLHAFIKKSQRTPKAEIELALHRRRESES